MDIVARLKEAQRAITEAGLEADLREAGFRFVLELQAKQKSENSPEGSGHADNPGPLGSIAAKLNLPLETVREVYAFEGDQLKLLVPPRQLESSKAGATKQIALLVIAGRQAANPDEGWTGVEVVRAMAEEYGVYDSPNFSSALSAIGDELRFTGKNKERKAMVTRRGLEKARELIERIMTADR